MAKKPNASARDALLTSTVSADPAAALASALSNPQNTPASESGDAAGKASAELVKPQDNIEPTPAIPAAAAPEQSGPEVEASASGTNSEIPSESGGHGTASAGDGGDPATVALSFDPEDAQEEFFAKYPLITAAMETWKANATGAMPVLRVTAKKAGFRRGGIAHPAEPVDHDLRVFSADLVEAILGEAMLIAEIV